MARIVSFPAGMTPRQRPHAPAVAGAAGAEILIFPGVRVEYHDDTETLDLSRRIQSPRRRTTNKAAF